MSKKKTTSSEVLPATITDKTTGEVVSIPDFLRLDTSVAFTGVLDIRANLAKTGGSFAVYPMKADIGSRLVVSVLDFRIERNIRPSEEYTEPGDFAQMIVLVWDAEGLTDPAFACITYGGCSVEDASALFDWFRINKVHPLSKRLTMSIDLVSGSKFKFHVIKLETSDATKDDLVTIKEMVESNTSVLNGSAFRSIPNIDAK